MFPKCILIVFVSLSNQVTHALPFLPNLPPVLLTHLSAHLNSTFLYHLVSLKSSSCLLSSAATFCSVLTSVPVSASGFDCSSSTVQTIQYLTQQSSNWFAPRFSSRFQTGQINDQTQGNVFVPAPLSNCFLQLWLCSTVTAPNLD